jgi:hypothetical protein
LPDFIKIALMHWRNIRVVLVIWISWTVYFDKYWILLGFYDGLLKDILGLELMPKLF